MTVPMDEKIDLKAFFCETCGKFVICEHLTLLYQDKNSIVRQNCEKVFEKITTYGFLMFSNVPDTFEANTSLNIPAIQEFFNSPLETKLQALSKDRARRGYCPVSTENFATLVGVSGKPNDSVEKFRIGPQYCDVSEEIYVEYFTSKESRIHFFPNDFTSVSSDFESTALRVYNAMEFLAKLFLNIFELACQLPAHSLFQSRFSDYHTSILTFNYFAALDSPECTERIADHTDVSVFTILSELFPNNSLDGNCELQILDLTNEHWQTIAFEENCVGVNIGDCFNYLSMGRLKSARHRVVQRDRFRSQCRLTSAFFYTPSYDVFLSWPGESPETHMTYTDWRKQLIAKAMKKLKK